MKLTIAIPTYDRFEALKHTLEIIIPQLCEGVELVVLDNASPRPVDKLLSNLAKQHGVEHRIRLIRNPCNIGANANILRCFEMAQGEWVWVLGDDDNPALDAIQVIQGAIIGRKAICAILFKSDHPLHKYCCNAACVYDKNAPHFFGDAFPGLTFISTMLYHRDAIVGKMRYGYDMAYACLPHFSMMMAAVMEDEMSVIAHPQPIASALGSEAQQSYSFFKVKTRFLSVLELPFLTNELRTSIDTGITSVSYPSSRSIYADFILVATGLRQHGGQFNDAKFYFNQWFVRNRNWRRIGLSRIISWRLFNWLLGCDSLAFAWCWLRSKFFRRHTTTVSKLNDRL